MSPRLWRWSLLTFVAGVTILGAIIGLYGRYYLNHPKHTLFCVGKQRIYKPATSAGKQIFSDVFVCWEKQPLESERVLYIVVVPGFRGNWGCYGKGQTGLQWVPFAGNSTSIIRFVNSDGTHGPNDIGIFWGELWFNDEQVELDARPEKNVFVLDFEKQQLVRVDVVTTQMDIKASDWKRFGESPLWIDVLSPIVEQ